MGAQQPRRALWVVKGEAVRRARNTNEHDLSPIGGQSEESSLLQIPDDVFLNLGGRLTAEAVTRHCEHCGEVIPPRHCLNGYLPGKCPCEVERRRKEEQRQTMQLNRQERTRQKCSLCYTWLGEEWRDESMEEMTFGNFDSCFQPDALLTALAFADHPIGNLIFWSDASWGTGKTHLAAAVCNHLLSQDMPCLFTTAQNMFNAFNARRENNRGHSDLLAMAGEYPLLVIDDLDKVGTLTQFKQSVFFEVLNMRNKRRLPTAVTTNASVELLYNDIVGVSDFIGRAAASRLADMGNGGVQVVEMNGEDYRRRAR